jgi:LmbE family N-acetylglucosaminyl deacetylase
MCRQSGRFEVTKAEVTACFAGDVLSGFKQAPVTNWQDIVRAKAITILAPHPDDETLGCGGLIALCARAGVAVCVIVMTDGSQSHPNAVRWSSDDITAQREREVRAAMIALGAPHATLIFLHIRDGYLDKVSDPTALVDQIVAIIRTNGSAELFLPWEADPHPDHVATARIGLQIAQALPTIRVFAYPIWGLTLGSHDLVVAPHRPAFRIEIRSVKAAKRAAIVSHQSQTTNMIDDPTGFRLNESDIALFCADFEVYIDMMPERSGQYISSVPRSHFDSLYANSPDPWQYQTSRYEREKFAQTVAVLPDRRYDRACEIGCSIGTLTRVIAGRVSALLAIDFSVAAIDHARASLADLENVELKIMHVPHELPAGQFDLLVFSEVLYFFSRDEFAKIAQFVVERLTLNGVCVLVNYLGDTESPLSGDEASDNFGQLVSPNLHVTFDQRFDGYRITLFERNK